MPRRWILAALGLLVAAVPVPFLMRLGTAPEPVPEGVGMASPPASPSASPSPTAMPAVVAEKRDAIADAAASGRFGRVAELLHPSAYRSIGNPRAYLQQQYDDGLDVLPMLERILEAPYRTEADGRFVWPSIYRTPPFERTDAESGWELALEDVEDDVCASYDAEGRYVGFHVIIDATGAWVSLLPDPATSC